MVTEHVTWALAQHELTPAAESNDV
jgi:hypothetical protein